MEELVVWLMAAYGCSSFLVMLADKWADRMSSCIEPPQKHYRLLVGDSEQVLERVVRRLLFRSYWSGRPIRISLIDAGSTDDTGRIASLLARDPDIFRLLYEGQEEQERMAQTDIFIDLRLETKRQKA